MRRENVVSSIPPPFDVRERFSRVNNKETERIQHTREVEHTRDEVS